MVYTQVTNVVVGRELDIPVLNTSRFELCSTYEYKLDKRSSCKVLYCHRGLYKELKYFDKFY
jgi:hypothetical protein